MSLNKGPRSVGINLIKPGKRIAKLQIEEYKVFVVKNEKQIFDLLIASI